MFKLIIAIVGIASAGLLGYWALHVGNKIAQTPTNETAREIITGSANCPTHITDKSKWNSLISASSTPSNPNTVSFSIIPSDDDQIDNLFINGPVVDFGDGTCAHPFEFPVNCGEKAYCFAGAAVDHTYTTSGTYTARLLVPIARRCKQQDYKTCLWQLISTTTISIVDDRSSRRSQ